MGRKRAQPYDATAWLLLPVAAVAAFAWYRFCVARLTPTEVPAGMRLFYPDSCIISAAFAALTAAVALGVVSPYIERTFHPADDDSHETRRVQLVCAVLAVLLGFITYSQMSEAQVVAVGGERIVAWTVTYDGSSRQECDVGALVITDYRSREWRHQAVYTTPAGLQIVNMIGQGELNRTIRDRRGDGGLPEPEA